jgi:hypothetical protein
MTRAKLHAEISRADHLFSLVATISSEAEVQAHWAQYLCVRVAGLIETAIAMLLTDYCESRCTPELQRYLRSNLGRFQNANPEKIKQLLSSFNGDWGADIESFWEERRKGSITSIFNNRHLIAHGKASSITVGRLQPWYDDAKEVLEFVRAILFD